MMRMMYRSRSLADEEMRPASPPGKPGANSMLLVPDLRPLRMWPCHYAKAADAVGYLKAIEHVEARTPPSSARAGCCTWCRSSSRTRRTSKEDIDANPNRCIARLHAMSTTIPSGVTCSSLSFSL
ncbi:hypothetical protein PF010_g27217 [Phytophthora fragariae]|uniref:Uncharacterized protein n=1 Tax=Phytophthora fragariae TaxID=53985 RepID=A0A6G0JUK2_9STRA|nr:hypothetical protein PF010_g27217 [Phytophthora fragariae]KAE9172981.1 hypothetical protein PF004_g27114 [Phytophthora fragariae]